MNPDCAIAPFGVPSDNNTRVKPGSCTVSNPVPELPLVPEVPLEPEVPLVPEEPDNQ